MNYLQNYLGFGGNKPIPNSKGSLDRFVIVSNHIRKTQNFMSRDGVQFGFEGVEAVANGATKWKVVYDLHAGHIHFATQSSPQLKMVDTKKFNFDCKESVKVYDMTLRSSGDVTAHFSDYSADDNAALVRKSLGRSVPAQLVEAANALPETTSCVH